MKRFIMAGLAVAAASCVALAPMAPASGLGTASATVGAPSNVTPNSCSLPVTYSWSGFAGNNDTAALWMTDSQFGAVTSTFQQIKVRGSGGTVSHTFDGMIPGVQYSGWGELRDIHGNTILGSRVFSSFTAC